jgi:hypothetical protein
LTILAFANITSAQVQTEVPGSVPGAKPVALERIKIHGASLEGNLEGDDVDRTVIVFLPPSYVAQKSRRHFEIGKKLASLRDEQILTVGTAFHSDARSLLTVAVRDGNQAAGRTHYVSGRGR